LYQRNKKQQNAHFLHEFLNLIIVPQEIRIIQSNT